MNEEKKAKKGAKTLDKKIIIIIAVVVAVVIGLIVVLVSKPGSGNNGPGGTKQEANLIVLSGEKIGNGKILVTANSTKEGTYAVNFNVTFYDTNKEVLRVFEESIQNVPAGGKAYQIIDINGLINQEYTFEVKSTNETLRDASKVLTDKVTATSTKNDTEVVVELNNTTDNSIDAVQVAVLFKKANKVVGYTSQFITNFSGQSKLNEIVYIPTDEAGEPIDFENHEVIISAYNREQ